MTKSTSFDHGRLKLYPGKNITEDDLLIHFFPHYKGDFIVIQIPDPSKSKGKKNEELDESYTNLLIDCSSYSSTGRTRDILRNILGIKNIHYMIVTHPDDDHCKHIKNLFFEFCFEKQLTLETDGALVKKIEKVINSASEPTKKQLERVLGDNLLCIKKIFLPGNITNSFQEKKKYFEFRQLADKFISKIDENIVQFPSDSPIPEGGRTVLKIGKFSLIFLGPSPAFIEKDRIPNNYSLFFQLVWGENDFIFPGDAEKDLWNDIFGEIATKPTGDVKLEIDPLKFLKLAHHGSDNGTPRHLYEAVSFSRDGVGFATRHPSNPLKERNIDLLFPRPDVINILKGNTKKGKGKPLDGHNIYAYSHDRSVLFHPEGDSNKEADWPYLYSFICRDEIPAEGANLWGYRIFDRGKKLEETLEFFKKDENKGKFIQIENYPYWVVTSDKIFSGREKKSRKVSENLVKVMLTWLQSQLV